MADRILIVDDESSLRDALSRILTAEGYEVRQAGDGKEALGILGAQGFAFLLCTLRRAAERERLRTENDFLRSEIEKTSRPEEILYASRSMEEVVRTAGKVKDYDATVLVTGESGTGKELVARLLPFGGRRKGEPFVAVNCGAIPETLLESELFGHRRGAFTGAVRSKPGLFEVAHGGTIFLDEIGDTSPATQVKLLRVLDTS